MILLLRLHYYLQIITHLLYHKIKSKINPKNNKFISNCIKMSSTSQHFSSESTTKSNIKSTLFKPNEVTVSKNKIKRNYKPKPINCAKLMEAFIRYCEKKESTLSHPL